MFIDRSIFYEIHSDKITHKQNGPIREINSGEFNRFFRKIPEGISNINTLSYNIDENTGFINVHNFSTGFEENMELRKQYDIRNGVAPFKTGHPFRKNTQMAMFLN